MKTCPHCGKDLPKPTRKKKVVIHKEGRPPPEAIEVERWVGDDTFIPDDGRPGVAFSGRLPHAKGQTPYTWHGGCPCGWGAQDCPVRQSTDRTCKRYGCSNGYPFHKAEP